MRLGRFLSEASPTVLLVFLIVAFVPDHPGIPLGQDNGAPAARFHSGSLKVTPDAGPHTGSKDLFGKGKVRVVRVG